MVAADLGIDPVEFRRRNLIAESGDAVSARDRAGARHQGRMRQRRLSASTLDRCLAEFKWAEQDKLQGKLIDGRYHGIAVGCYLEGGGTGPKENAQLVSSPRARSRSMSARRRSGRASRRCSRRSPPMRLKCRWSASGKSTQARPTISREGFGSFSSRSIVMGGNAIVNAANSLRDADSRGGGTSGLDCATNEIGFDRGMAVGPDRAAIDLKEFAGLFRRRHACQQQAHLFLWRACRPCRGRSENRSGRADRLCRGRGCRPHRQSADAARPVRRRRRSRPWRRVS